MDYYINLTIIAAVSFVSGLILTRLLIRKAWQNSRLVPDMYKPGRPPVPTLGGLAIMGASLIALVVAEFVTQNVAHLLLFYFVALVFGLYGLADDLFTFKRRYDKVLILFFLALPAAILTTDTDLDLIVVNLSIGAAYPYLFVPFYIMVIANLVNFHSGFNGLSTGLSVILFLFAAIYACVKNNGESLLVLAPILPALVAFYLSDRYPSRILLGNVGSFYIGGALGGYLVLSNMELFGFVIFLPHIVSFLMDMWTAKIRRVPFAKFGRIRPDGTIEPPPQLKFGSLKFLVTSLARLTEVQAVLVLYAITMVFCLLGMVLIR